MKENKNHIPTEGFAEEPIGAVALNNNDERLYSVDNWPGMPLVGPTDVDEVKARIDEAEREIANGEVYDWNSVMMEAVDLVNHYANKVY